MMKRGLRSVAFLLALCMLTLSLSSCMIISRIYNEYTKMEAEALSDLADSDKKGNQNEELTLTFTLTDQDFEKFESLLEECEAESMTGKNFDAIDKLWEKLEKQYFHIATQAQIAYLLYCCNMSDEELSDNYLFATDMQSNAYGLYVEVCQKLDVSDAPYRDYFFSNWTEEELVSMRQFTEEMTSLSQANDRLLVEYYELDPSDADDAERILELYSNFITNNDGMVPEKGYANYYEYASEQYARESTQEDRENFRAYVGEYIVPLFDSVLEALLAEYEELSTSEKLWLRRILERSYDSMDTNYVTEYLDSYTGETKRAFSEVLESDNSIFTTSSKAYNGAYTAYLDEYERPFSFFGPDYSDTFTVVHEMGHYYSALYVPTDLIPLDLAEVHSQGNEFLFLSFLSEELDENLFRVVELNQLCDSLSVIIMATIVDEFEETVYSDIESYTNGKRSYDQTMQEICERYGGLSYLEENVADMTLYWKYVVFDAPVYYISYSVSAIAALSLYVEATEDEEGAREIFFELAENPDPDLGFRENLTAVGLPDPYTEAAFQMLWDAFS